MRRQTTKKSGELTLETLSPDEYSLGRCGREMFRMNMPIPERTLFEVRRHLEQCQSLLMEHRDHPLMQAISLSKRICQRLQDHKVQKSFP